MPKYFQVCLVILLGSVCASKSFADITDFDRWTRVADPAHPGFAGSATSDFADLFAFDQPIPSGTDIGFQSVDGNSVATSMGGFYFDSAADFSLAVSFDVSFSGTPVGALGLGFGIGEDGDGRNSAGVAMVTNNGNPFLTFAGAARINDVNQTPRALSTVPASLSGTLFVDYAASTGDVTVGASQTIDAAAAQGTAVYAGVQRDWEGGDLMASFFLRSQDGFGLNAWQGGQATARFSNFRVLSGAAVAIPEPSVALAMLLSGSCLAMRRRRARLE